MQKVIVVASIGNRDMTYPDVAGKVRNPGIPRDTAELAAELDLSQDDANLRAVSCELLRRYDEEEIPADRFGFPILRPGLEHILKENKAIDELLMIVTDQKAGAFRKSDTVHCGELLARLVTAAFPGRVTDTSPRFLVVDSEPQKPNVMYPLIRGKLSELSAQHDDAKFYVVATGGTPAITDGLRQAAMNVFPDHRCSVVQVDPPTAAATVGTARVVEWEPYLEDVARNGARALVEKGNFVGALEVLAPRGSWPAAARRLLEHADARVSLRLSRARKTATAARKAMTIDAGTGLDDALRGVEVHALPASAIAKVNEVRFLVELALEQQRYADALVRIEQFRESVQAVFSLGVLGLLAHLGEPLPADAVSNCTWTTHGMTLEKWLGNGAAEFNRTARHWVMRYDRDKQALFNFAQAVAIVPGRPHVEQRKKLVARLGTPHWGKLAAVRNRSIHTTAGVSEASITGVLSLEDLKTLLEATAGALFGSFDVARVTAYPYEALKRAIVDILAP